MKPPILTRTAVGTVASLAVLMPLAGCGSDDSSTSTRSPSTSPTTPQSPTGAPEASSATPSATGGEDTEYADGTYTARGYYGGAPSYMTFTVTLDDGILTEVSSELMPDNNATSRGYQERFAAALPDEVIGKSVEDVEVGKLAGSSSCGDGFNDAIAQIREQASTA